MKRALLLCAAIVSCAPAPARAPAAVVDLPSAFAAAFRADATGEPADAARAYLGVVRAASRAAGDPWQLAALEASLDALATRSMPSLGDDPRDAALANRTRLGPEIEAALTIAQGEAAGPFAKGLIARTLTTMAEDRGDADAAARWRTAGGCAREALVTGPVTWAPLTGVSAPGPLDRAGAPIEPLYPTGGPFEAAVAPAVIRGRGCAIDLSAARGGTGAREVVVDVDVPRAQTIGFAIWSHGAAVVRVAGQEVLRRPFELGDGDVARFASLDVPAGTLRLVASVGTAREDDAIEISLWQDDGGPLAARAPAVGSASTMRVSAARPYEPPQARRDDERLLASVAALASGDPHEAERMLWPGPARADSPPELALAYGRAVLSARDLSAATRTERARSAYERVLDAWPGSWEASIEHAVLAGDRRGRDEAAIETLRDLDALRDKRKQAVSPIVDAFDAITSGGEQLFDRARAALARARPALDATPLWRHADDAATPRLGAEEAAAECDPSRRTGRASLACFDALRSVGDHAGAMREIDRLRAVLGAPLRFGALEVREGYATGDRAAVARGSEKLMPGARTLSWLLAPSLLDDPRAVSPDELRSLVAKEAGQLRDVPAVVAPLLRAVGDDPTREFNGWTERIVAEDRAAGILPAAATAILAHVERYDVAPSGFVAWRLFDVRRVSGTTDVEENAQAAPPAVWGRGSMRALRRRIFKRDGRVLEPEHTPRASQAHADLAQLEQGDIVEAIYEGWALPSDTGDVGIDTPDLLPDRAAVHDATIELRLPRTLAGSLWSHPVLGRPDARDDRGTKVLTWHLHDELARRIEDGVPKMDRNANVSFSTATWPRIAQSLREAIASLEEHEPEMADWARSAAPDAGATRATVDAIVVAAGKALRESDPGTLSDYGGGLSLVQSRTARTFLTSHDGSRSWLIVRALEELGVRCDVVVAENEPYSADPSFPPHFGRFSHPLVVAHLKDGDVWVDADVQGPPLPAGRISPELRGRLALHTDGTIAPLPALKAEGERDEVDLRLALDARGNARGSVTVVLRGRTAQDLSEALFRIVGADRQRALRDVVLAWLPWANVDDVKLASSEGSWQVGLRAEVSVSGYAQLESGKTWLLPGLDALHGYAPRAYVAGLAATFATRGRRQSALALNNAVQYHVHRRVELPKGATVARLPGPLDVRSKLVEASRAIAVGGAGAGQTIEEDFVLGVATGTIPAVEYDAFVGVTRATDDGFLASTRITLP
jgi:hypothetical protein